MTRLNLIRKPSKASYERMLVTLAMKDPDGFELLGTGMLTALGAAGGALSAGTVAGLAGTTSIFGVTTAASWVGVTAVAATPVGWVAGCAIAGGGLAYGISRMVKNGVVNTERRKRLLEDLIEKIQDFRAEASEMSEREQFKRAIDILLVAHFKNRITQDSGMVIVSSLRDKQITPQEAVEKINQLCICEKGK